MPEDFGSYLKHERELRGVPLDNIAETTKISIRFLRALEESRFEDLPGEVFIKGFIRSYGQAIGSNVDELLAVYHESGNKQEDTATSAEAPPLSQEEPTGDKPAFPMKAVLGFGIALLIIAGGAYWFTSGKGERAGQSQPALVEAPSVVDNTLPEVEIGGEPPTPAEESPPTPAPNPTDAAGPSESPKKAIPDEPPAQTTGSREPIKNTVTVSEKDAIIEDMQNQAVPSPMEASAEEATGDLSLSLVIRVDENSWFNLRVDDQRDQDFILPPGGSKTVQAKNAIVMTIGNRRATQLELNGQQLDLPDSPDNVIRNLTVNAEQLN